MEGYGAHYYFIVCVEGVATTGKYVCVCSTYICINSVCICEGAWK